MILTCTNVTGDAAVTLIVAKHEKLLDMNVYRS
jgi:Na+/H+-dicarboxylate symporter